MKKPIAAKTLLLATIICVASSPTHAQPQSSAQPQPPIPMDQLGVVAGKQYQGEGLTIRATLDGARLHCVFQRLEGEVTSEGLWLHSTADDSPGERFRVMAVKVGRDTPTPLWTAVDPFAWLQSPLPSVGAVKIAGQVASYVRDTLTEEYSVSMDGVRQDFVIQQRSVGGGDLRVELDVAGAIAESWVSGARLTLIGSGRKLAYTRLHVADARGCALTARIEVITENRLAIVVDDGAAVYPVRIDPTFSDADWFSMGGIPGADAIVRATAVDSLGNFYIGGDFTIAGTVIASNVAKWNGSSWSTLGSGLNGRVYALAFSGSDVFAGGDFTTAGGIEANKIAKWNGSSWSTLGSGMDGGVYALAVSGSDIFAGGFFRTAGGIDANSIAKWDGNGWLALGSGMDSSVYALATSGTNLYVGGGFTTATNSGGIPVSVSRIAKWDGSRWSSLGSGVSSFVQALAVSGTNVFVGGSFLLAGGNPASRIAKWNGNSWTNLGTGLDGIGDRDVYALAMSGNDLYAGGAFTIAGGVAANYMAKWNGTNWSALGSGVNGGSALHGYVFGLATFGTNVYVGGLFQTAGGKVANNVARLNGTNWSALGLGMNAPVYALAVSGSNLYAGGVFQTASAISANFVVKWDGSSWSALGAGMGGAVLALAASGSNVFAGGWFTTAGGISANHVAKWNGSSWTNLGSGMNLGGYVQALAFDGTNLYTGGVFTNAGGVAAKRVARWNGASWSALGSGMDGNPGVDVNALAVTNGIVYAGGYFTTAGGVGANNIAKWNGSSWSSLGLGVNASVHALAISGDDVYAGGSFYEADGIPALSIARWNGVSWSPLDSGVNGLVRSVAVFGSNVYAGGGFTIAGGNSAHYIAKWDGVKWSPLGSGVNAGDALYVTTEMHALAISASSVYAGGNFLIAGNKASGYIAKANLIGSTPASPGRFVDPVYSAIGEFSCTFLDASIGEPYRIQTSPSLEAGSWTDFTSFTYSGPVVITDASAGSGTNKFFRAVTP